MSPAGGFLDTDGACEFLGGRSRSWIRGKIATAGLPCRRLFDRLLFDPTELRAWVEKNATRPQAVDLDSIVSDVVGSASCRGGRGKRRAA